MRARLRLLLLLGPCLWPGLAPRAEAEVGAEPWTTLPRPPDHASSGATADAALLATVMRRLAAVRQSRALFTEEKTLAALRVPLRSSGRLAYRRPDRLEKITEWPRSEVLSVQGDRLSLITDNTTRTIDLAAQPAVEALVEAILGTLAGDLPGLRRWYHVAATGTPVAWRLTLRPRTGALAKLVGEVAITGSGDRLTRLRTIQANGDISIMTISPAA